MILNHHIRTLYVLLNPTYSFKSYSKNISTCVRPSLSKSVNKSNEDYDNPVTYCKCFINYHFKFYAVCINNLKKKFLIPRNLKLTKPTLLLVFSEHKILKYKWHIRFATVRHSLASKYELQQFLLS